MFTASPDKYTRRHGCATSDAPVNVYCVAGHQMDQNKKDSVEMRLAFFIFLVFFPGPMSRLTKKNFALASTSNFLCVCVCVSRFRRRSDVRKKKKYSCLRYFDVTPPRTKARPLDGAPPVPRVSFGAPRPATLRTGTRSAPRAAFLIVGSERRKTISSKKSGAFLPPSPDGFLLCRPRSVGDTLHFPCALRFLSDACVCRRGARTLRGVFF